MFWLGWEIKDYFIGAAAAGKASEVSTQDPRCRDLAEGGGEGEMAALLIFQLGWALICSSRWEWVVVAQDIL